MFIITTLITETWARVLTEIAKALRMKKVVGADERESTDKRNVAEREIMHRK